MNASTGGKAAALEDFIILNEEIAALVRARLPLESNLARVGAELPGRAGALAEKIGRRMERGETLPAAMDAECASLPAAYRATMIAGVQSGQLASALESLVDTASRQEQLRRITGVALIYPLVIVVVTCLLLALVVSRVVPSFDWLDRPHYGWLTQLTEWPLAVPVLGIVVPCVVAITAFAWWRRSGRLGGARSIGSAALAWLPGTRGVHYWSQSATFAELLLLLVERGLPLDQALRLAAEATDDRSLRVGVEQLAAEIRQGDAVRPTGADSVQRVRSEFPLLIRLALHHTGDRSLLAGSLRQAAAMYRERAIRAAEWYAEYLPVLLVVGIGGTVTIGFTLLVLWPYIATLHELAGWNWR